VSRYQPPAYWLTRDQSQSLVRFLRDGHLDKLNVLILNEATEIPADEGEVYATLFGELIPFLRGVAHIPFPGAVKPEVELSRDERLAMAGICYVLSREEAQVADAAIGRFIETATDEVLSGDGAFLILYMDEPQAVRKGVAHLQKALAIPPEYDATLFVCR
jgi:hypothetical protein